jgi:hypothetical protein
MQTQTLESSIEKIRNQEWQTELRLKRARQEAKLEAEQLKGS